jgi:heat shock protein HslJ
MKTSILPLLAICAVVLANSCKTASKNPSVPVGDNSMTSLDWDGTYYTVLPCADCEGIESTLTLNKDLTYRLVNNYLGKDGAKPNIATGTFKWSKDGGRISLSDRTPSDLIVGENQLFQLDIKGKMITGDLADKYRYQKLDMGITEKYWKLTEIMGKPVTPWEGMTKEPHMILKAADFHVNANGGCNQMNGSFTLMPMNRIRFSQMISTMMACPNMEIERQLSEVLQQADSYILDGDKLQLIKARMAPLAKFEAVYMK